MKFLIIEQNMRIRSRMDKHFNQHRCLRHKCF